MLLKVSAQLLGIFSENVPARISFGENYLFEC